LIEASFDGDMSSMPYLKFKLEGYDEVQAQANIIKTLSDAGYEVNAKDLSDALGFRVFKKDFTGGTTNA
jgi:hypothetical protein